MMLRRFLLIAVAAFSIIAVACSGGGGDIEPADSYASLSISLESAGMKVGEQVENKFLFSDIFSVPGIRLMASGQELLAFEFANAEEASAQADLVSVDGYGIGLKYINWIEEPQYFLNGRMIVVYDGAQSLVIDTLVAAMGEQFVDSSSGL